MTIQIKSWETLTKDEFFEIARLRCEVFFVEQRVDEQDFDDVDRAPGTLHLFIRDHDGVAAYLRTYPLAQPEEGATRSFGRVVVRADRRGEGLAQRLIEPVIEQFGHEDMVIHSQDYVRALYRRFGFTEVGEVYVEAGIPHRMMVRPADAASGLSGGEIVG